MNLEKQLEEKFEVEELEKRYEFGWIKSAEVGAEVDSDGKLKGTIKMNF